MLFLLPVKEKVGSENKRSYIFLKGIMIISRIMFVPFMTYLLYKRFFIFKETKG